ncbi:MAG TPA: hypothetical protein VJ257_02720, partial [Solirubrobacterales bacterium]|nr:hypothetical protein [Solirubrobacterales bacterium]
MRARLEEGALASIASLWDIAIKKALGQGGRALILVTTNEPLGKLHPAALRPGRAMATVEFAPLESAEASAWLAERGVERRIDSPATIAELHAILAGFSA